MLRVVACRLPVGLHAACGDAPAATASLALGAQLLQSRDEMDARLGGGQICLTRQHAKPTRTGSRTQPSAPPCQVFCHVRFSPPPRLDSHPPLSQIEVPALLAGHSPLLATASARSSRAPAGSAVPAAASSGQGSEATCGSAILWPGEDEPHIARVLIYTSKQPMHEPI
jgi:hypothetical protein